MEVFKKSFNPSFKYHLEHGRDVEILHGDSTALLLAAKLDLEMKLKEDKSGQEDEKEKAFNEITKFLIDNGADVTALGKSKKYLLPSYILGMLTYTTILDQHWGGD